MADDFDDDLDDDFEEEDFDDEELDDEDDSDEAIVDDEIIDDEEDEEEASTEEEEEDEDVLDLEEELHPDDVEAPLDALLAERVTAGSLDDDDEDDGLDERGSTKVIPRRDSEFHCSSCFLVLPNHMLADKKKMLCRDCA